MHSDRSSIKAHVLVIKFQGSAFSRRNETVIAPAYLSHSEQLITWPTSLNNDRRRCKTGLIFRENVLLGNAHGERQQIRSRERLTEGRFADRGEVE